MTDECMRLQCVDKAQFDPASLTASYQPINGTGFSDTVKILKIFNPSTTISIDISLDGVTDHDFIPPLAFMVIDCQTNHADGPIYGTGTLSVAKGQVLWAKTASQPTYIQIVGYR